jgi:hypothetical protein
MAVREQLAAGVARVRAALDSGGPPPVPDWPRCGEIAIECRCDTLRMSVTSGMWGRVNAAETCGAGAGHLFFVSSRSRVEAHRDGSLAYWLTIRLMYCDQPWNNFTRPAYPTADFNALLAALEPGAVPPDVPPERVETWHDRPGLL